MIAYEEKHRGKLACSPSFETPTYGGRFSYTRREKDDRYPDPDNPGMMCRNFKIGGITGSHCSNF